MPSVRRASKRQLSPPNSSKKRQQTITQMHPFYPLYHPEIDQEDLHYEEDITDARDVQPRRSKRRKVVADKFSAQSNLPQSPKAMVSEEVTPLKRTIQFKEEPVRQDRLEACEDLQALKMMPPPPKTPTSRRIMEIPSSQSPADTPLSSSSRKSTHHVSRSPLKEKSLNIGIAQMTSPSKSRQLTDVKEIADSLENQEAIHWSSSNGHTNREKIRKTAEEIYEELLAQPTPSAYPSAKGIHENRRMEEDARTNGNRRNQRYLRTDDNDHAHVRTEILDSDLEESEESRDQDEAYTGRRCTTSPYRETRSARSNFEIVSSSIPEENTSPTSPSVSKVNQDPRPSIDVPSSQPTHNSPLQKTTQDLASDQLHHELSLYTQARGDQLLITESQYENEWTSYHGPLAAGSMPPQSSSPLQPLSSAPLQVISGESESQPVPLMPTERLSQTNGTTTTTTKPKAGASAKRPVPPSQATTVDTTQATHPNQQPNSSQAPLASSSFSSPPCPPQQPPAPLEPSSSSPLLSRKGASQGQGYQWDGKILTDSQLLPASVMDDSLDLYGLPGGWKYEDTAAEEEEEEEDEEL